MLGSMQSWPLNVWRLIDHAALKSAGVARGGKDGVRILGRKTVELMTRNHLRGDMAEMGQPRFSESPLLPAVPGIPANVSANDASSSPPSRIGPARPPTCGWPASVASTSAACAPTASGRRCCTTGWTTRGRWRPSPGRC